MQGAETGTMERVLAAFEAVPGFDCAGGLARLRGNRELYYRLTLHFFNNSHLEALRLALTQNDAGRAAGAAHAMKGAALNMGFNSIAGLADSIGISLKAGHTEQAGESLRLLEELYARAAELTRMP